MPSREKIVRAPMLQKGWTTNKLLNERQNPHKEFHLLDDSDLSFASRHRLVIFRLRRRTLIIGLFTRPVRLLLLFCSTSSKWRVAVVLPYLKQKRDIRVKFYVILNWNGTMHTTEKMQSGVGYEITKSYTPLVRQFSNNHNLITYHSLPPPLLHSISV